MAPQVRMKISHTPAFRNRIDLLTINSLKRENAPDTNSDHQAFYRGFVRRLFIMTGPNKRRAK